MEISKQTHCFSRLNPLYKGAKKTCFKKLTPLPLYNCAKWDRQRTYNNSQNIKYAHFSILLSFYCYFCLFLIFLLLLLQNNNQIDKAKLFVICIYLHF